MVLHCIEKISTYKCTCAVQMCVVQGLSVLCQCHEILKMKGFKKELNKKRLKRLNAECNFILDVGLNK